jgi:hypothetical protein
LLTPFEGHLVHVMRESFWVEAAATLHQAWVFGQVASLKQNLSFGMSLGPSQLDLAFRKWMGNYLLLKYFIFDLLSCFFEF